MAENVLHVAVVLLADNVLAVIFIGLFFLLLFSSCARLPCLSPCRTKETLASGNYLSVINILMQLRKVCVPTTLLLLLLLFMFIDVHMYYCTHAGM